MTDARATPLAEFHLRHGARMTPFAGWALPLNYPPGVKAEHEHTREAVSLFDVSHMGQVALRPGSGDPADAARALEALVPGDILGLAEGAMRYTQLTTDSGGIIDDLMVTRRDDDLLLVLNAARAAADIAHLQDRLPGDVTIEPLENAALIALQGPQSAEALAPLIHDSHRLSFMQAHRFDWAGDPLWISRSGYTGEDGFEIGLAADIAEELAEAFMEDDRVRPAGWARAIRCGSRRGCACMARTSTKPHRPSRRRLPGRSAGPGARAAPAPAAFPVPTASCANWPMARPAAASG
jgi:aminomethyltransferase